MHQDVSHDLINIMLFFVTHFRSRALLGEPGKDIEIHVPCGVCVKTDSDRTLGRLQTRQLYRF